MLLFFRAINMRPVLACLLFFLVCQNNFINVQYKVFRLCDMLIEFPKLFCMYYSLFFLLPRGMMGR